MSAEGTGAAANTVDETRKLFAGRGSQWYGGEAVSQLEHALQAAWFAEREAASPELIVAALLHDIGHLLQRLPEDAVEQGLDDRHEAAAITWLAHRFPPSVYEPVGLHVAAKRYLCAADPAYLAQLSPTSQGSLRLQGGPMSPDERLQFEQHPYFEDAVRLRKWDDAAKVAGLKTPTLDHFVSYLQRVHNSAGTAP